MLNFKENKDLQKGLAAVTGVIVMMIIIGAMASATSLLSKAWEEKNYIQLGIYILLLAVGFFNGPRYVEWMEMREEARNFEKEMGVVFGEKKISDGQDKNL